jgi:hypothetical protein
MLEGCRVLSKYRGVEDRAGGCSHAGIIKSLSPGAIVPSHPPIEQPRNIYPSNIDMMESADHDHTNTKH